MDLVAEYAHAYGGAPRPDQPWHEIAALASRIGRFDLRTALQVADGVMLGQPPSEETVVIRSMERAKLNRLAYPLDEELP